MKIIPHQPYETNSRAEYRVFDKLKESFVNDDKYIAFHSLNFTKHQDKRFGEADFVIICEYGLFVFEVKGGGISCEDGVWQTINTQQEKHPIQNPFKQAETALHAINKSIKESHQFGNINIPIGYGVIFPDVERWIQGLEWDLKTICDSAKFRNFETFFRKFLTYWHTKKANKNTLSVENIKAIAQYLRPSFEVIESLYNQLHRLEQTAIQLTQDQYKYLDVVALNKRVLCSGGAGTGKTFLAVELARRIARADKKVIVICKSKWLKQYLTSKIVNEFTTIATIDSAKIDMRRVGISQYGALIVDEGQDLFNIDDIEILDAIVDGGLENGEWSIFHDINNQAGLFSAIDNDALALLSSFHPAKVPLTTNCRNTNPILKHIENLLAVDMGHKTINNGPKVIEMNDGKEKGAVLENMIDRLLNEGYPPSSITILSPFPYKKSSLSFLAERIQSKITKLDDFSIQFFPVPNISFAQIRDFKGLENQVIIVVDLMHPKKTSTDNKALHYVAMSRASALLVTIFSHEPVVLK